MIQQSVKSMNVCSSKILPDNQVPKNSRHQIDDMTQQLTMRKNSSNIQILQKIVSNKQNNKESMNLNTDNLRMIVRGEINNDKKIPLNNYVKMEQHKQHFTDKQKMQELKNRFKKIKSSYQINHQNLINNSMNDGYSMRSNETTRFGETTQFQTSQHQGSYLDSRQSRKKCDFSFQSKDHETSFQKVNQYEFKKMNQSSVETDRKQCSFGNLNVNQSVIDLKDKYRSLSKQLQTFQHTELIDLLIQEIEDNEKNKHMIEKTKYEIEKYRNQITNRQQQNNQLKKQLQSYKQQLQKLITNKQHKLNKQNTFKQTQKQQQKLKISQNQVQRLKTQLQKLKKQLESKRQQVQILLQTESKNLGIIQKLKKTNQNNKELHNSSLINVFSPQQMTEQRCKFSGQKSMSKMISVEQKIDYKLKHDQLQEYMHEYIANVNQAHQEYKRNLNQLKQTNNILKDTCHQLREQQRKFKEQQRNFKEQYNKLRKQYNTLKQQLSTFKQTKNATKSIDKQAKELQQLRTQAQRLTTSLSNSKLIISQLQQEFSLLKDQNTQLKSILSQKTQLLDNQSQLLEQRTYLLENKSQQLQNLTYQVQRLRKQLQKINSNYQQQLNSLSNSNQRLLNQKQLIINQKQLIINQNQHLMNQNQQLHKQMNEIESRIMSNTQTQKQIRQIVEQLTLSKHIQQTQIQQQLQTINQLKSTLNIKSNQINTIQKQLHSIDILNKQLLKVNSQCKDQQKLIQKIHKQLKSTQHKQSILSHKLKLITHSNSILQETICQMTQLITQLLSQHKNQQQHSNTLQNQLQSLTQQTKHIHSAFQWESTHKQTLQQMLTLFWQKQHQYISTNSSKPNNNLKHIQYADNINAHNDQQSCQISFKKCSQMTKQGSSSVFNKLSHHQDNKSSCKSSLWKNSNVDSPIIQTSAISHKYFSETDQDLVDNQSLSFNILKNSDKPNINSSIQSSSDINFYEKENKKVFDKKTK